MQYLVFEGTIPEGQYGAGGMTVWDTGTYEVEKWRDDEVIFTLTGRVGGPLGRVRLALIRTQGEGEKSQWLLHRMKEQHASPAGADHAAPAGADHAAAGSIDPRCSPARRSRRGARAPSRSRDRTPRPR